MSELLLVQIWDVLHAAGRDMTAREIAAQVDRTSAQITWALSKMLAAGQLRRRAAPSRRGSGDPRWLYCNDSQCRKPVRFDGRGGNLRRCAAAFDFDVLNAHWPAWGPVRISDGLPKRLIRLLGGWS